MVALNFDRARPEALLNLNEVAELRGWSRENGTLRLGAGLTYTEAMRGELARGAAGAGRSVAHGRLAADPQPRHDRREPRHGVARRRRASAAARREGRGRARERSRRAALPLEEFLVGVKRNALEPDELIVAVLVEPSGQPQTFMKVGPRNAMVIAVCSLAVVADRERGELRAAFGSAAPGVPLVTAPLGEAARSRSGSRRRRARSTTSAARPRTAVTRSASSRGARSRGASREGRGSRSTASGARPMSGPARACSRRCATGSSCPARRTRASRASAARARCSSTASSCARASCSPRRRTGTRS